MIVKQYSISNSYNMGGSAVCVISARGERGEAECMYWSRDHTPSVHIQYN